MCHSHDPKNRTCHWGFDSDNWRAYLHLAEDYTDTEREKMSKIVADFKNRYKPTSATTLTSKTKMVRHRIFLRHISLLLSVKIYNYEIVHDSIFVHHEIRSFMFSRMVKVDR